MVEHRDKAAGGVAWRSDVEVRRHGMRLEVLPRKMMPLGAMLIWILLSGVFAGIWLAAWEAWMVSGFDPGDLRRYLMRVLGITPALLAVGGPLLIWSFLQHREHQRGAILVIDQGARQVTLPRYGHTCPLAAVTKVGLNKGWQIAQTKPGHTSFLVERWLNIVIREGESEHVYRVGRNLTARGGMERLASMVAEAIGCPLDRSLLPTETRQASAAELQHGRGSLILARIGAVIFMAAGALSLVYGLQGLSRGYAASSWPAVQGRVISAEVVNMSRSESRYRAEVQYQYSVGGVEYTGDQIQPQDFVHGRRSEALRIVLRYPEGQIVDVYYNPRQPEMSLLEPGAQRSGYGITAFGAGFLAFGLFTYIVFTHVSRKGGSTSISMSVS